MLENVAPGKSPIATMPPANVQRNASVPLVGSDLPTTTVPPLLTAFASLETVPPVRSPTPEKENWHVPQVPPQSTPVSFGASLTPLVQEAGVQASLPVA